MPKKASKKSGKWTINREQTSDSLALLILLPSQLIKCLEANNQPQRAPRTSQFNPELHMFFHKRNASDSEMNQSDAVLVLLFKMT